MKHYVEELPLPEELPLLMVQQLDRIERTLSLIKMGGMFILLVVLFDYLADMGGFAAMVDGFSKR
jgi:hypothetical protein